MHKTTITEATFAHVQQKQIKSKSKRTKPKRVACAKCGKQLKTGDKAFRTTRKYLCEQCGSNVEI